MIVRVFRPTVHPGKEREFEAFLRDTAVPLVSRQPGLGRQAQLSDWSTRLAAGMPAR
jgi:hypothetical protein